MVVNARKRSLGKRAPLAELALPYLIDSRKNWAFLGEFGYALIAVSDPHHLLARLSDEVFRVCARFVSAQAPMRRVVSRPVPDRRIEHELIKYRARE
jgi:hypothetical protein